MANLSLLELFYKAPFVRFKSAKCLACTINSSERSVYLSFYIYLCHISDVLYLSFCKIASLLI